MKFQPSRFNAKMSRYWGLVMLVLLVFFSLVIGVFVKSDAQANVSPVQNLENSDSSNYPNCQPATTIENKANWVSDRDRLEQEWQAHQSDLSMPYIVGPNGWIFWNDYIDSYASQAVGRKSLSQSEVLAWKNYLSDLNQKFKNEGIAFYVVVTPSTSSIYGEELPSWMQELRGPTSMDYFMSQVRDLPVIDLRTSLRDAKHMSSEHLFSWSNSHWTDYGAKIAWSQIAECVNEDFANAGPLEDPAFSGIEIVGDFNEWAPMGVASQGSDWAKPVFTDDWLEVSVLKSDGLEVMSGSESGTDSAELPVETTVSKSWTGKSALILRDSMGTALSPYWQQAYSPTWQMAHLWDSAENFPNYSELIDKFNPDVVIVQLAERHLISVPSSKSPR